MTTVYEKFLESMKIGYEQWHDGTGYDLVALAAVPEEERPAVVDALKARLSPELTDWRDMEALGVLAQAGDAASLALLRQTMEKHTRSGIRQRAAEELERLGFPVDVERPLIRALARGDMSDEFSHALDEAPNHNTVPVRDALLRCARRARDASARVNAAAMALYLAGGAAEPFDWNHRPFFLRFNAESPSELEAAYQELVERMATASGRP